MAGISHADALKPLADGLALVYHEARNLRHLVNDGWLSGSGWERLLSLPTNPVKAWRNFQEIRTAAARRETAREAVGLFQERFHKNLEDLQQLYQNPHWKHASAYGGHAWKRVTAAVMALRGAIERRETGEIQGAAYSLLTGNHNNGTLRDKIRSLDHAVGIQTGYWWQGTTGEIAGTDTRGDHQY